MARKPVEMVVETITPALAEKYLGHNTKNRSIRKNRVAQYAMAMKEGRWVMTGEPIVFNVKGDVVDGQHRLLAAIEADVSFTSVVVRNVDEDAFTYMDSGLTRTHGDTLRVYGIPDPNHKAAAARLVLAYEGGYLHDTTQKTLKTHKAAVVEEIIGDELRYDSGTYHGHRLQRANGNVSAITAFYVLASRRFPNEKVVEFLDQLFSLIGLGAGSPVLALRRWLDNGRGASNTAHLSALIRAFNAYNAGTNLTLVRQWIPGQPFPMLEGGEKL